MICRSERGPHTLLALVSLALTNQIDQICGSPKDPRSGCKHYWILAGHEKKLSKSLQKIKITPESTTLHGTCANGCEDNSESSHASDGTKRDVPSSIDTP